MPPSAAVVGLGILVFLCGADLVFAERVGGVNVRWGHLALLVVAGAIQLREWRSGTNTRPGQIVVGAWVAFFVVYLAAALAAPDTPRTLLKLAWGVLNVSLAARLCLSSIPAATLLSGFAIAAVLMGGIVWVDAIATQWFTSSPLIGGAQRSFVFETRVIERPHAFHYEPSFLGGALAFGVPLLMGISARPAIVVGSVALVGSALVLTSSRTGILGLGVGALVYALLAARRGTWMEMRTFLAAALVAAALIAAFSLHAEGARYLRYIAGPLGPKAALERSTVGGTEAERMGNARYALAVITAEPLGHGVVAGEDRAIGIQTFNIWLEVGVESGLPGLVTFAAALLVTILWAARGGAVGAHVWAAWAVYLLVSLSFTQSFPRLDYWLWFFLAVRLARESGRVSDITNVSAPPRLGT